MLGQIPDNMAEMMALLDDPGAPLVMHYHVSLNTPLDVAALKAATRRMLEKHPRLSAKLTLDEHGAKWTEDNDLDTLVTKLWEANELSLAAFRALAIPFDDAPIFRVRYHPQEGLSLAMHHALADGRAGGHFLALLMHELHPSEAADKPPRVRKPGKLSLRQWCYAFLEAFTRVIDFLVRPPVLLGPIAYTAGARSFTKRVVPRAELDAMNAALKANHPGTTLNELLLAAVHLSADDVLAEQKERGNIHGGDKRISVMVPVDQRPLLGRSEAFANYSTNYSVRSSPAQRKDPRALIAHIHKQVEHARSRLAGFGSHLLFAIFVKLGATRKDRVFRQQHGKPRHLVEANSPHWRQFDTLLFTYLGKLRFPAQIEKAITEIEGYAPVLPPMGVAIDAATTKLGLHLWLHSCEATMSAQAAERFCDRVLVHARALLKLEQSCPVVGPTKLAGTRAFLKDPVALLETCAKAGDFVELKVLGVKQYVINHPALIEEVLVTKQKHFNKDNGARVLARVVGEGLLTADGEFWLRHRRMLQPAFSQERVKAYAQVMVQATQRAIADWKPLQQHNITQAMSEVTIDIVGRTLFGVETKRDAATVGTALNAVLAHLSNPLFVAMPWLVKLGFGRAFVRACEQLDALVTSLITQRRAYALDEGDLLGSMIAAMDAGVITERDLRNETLILFLTGHETAAVALPYVFHCIGQNPAVERKLAAELEHVLKGRTPTLDDIPALVYTEQIVKEALRLYPPAWSMGRKAISDVQIGGHIVPKGAQVWMGVWAMQRDPRYFEQPTVFNPDRWNTGGPREKFAYFPFGGGPRLCIGQGFSKTEMVLVLATIAQNFKLRFDELTPLELAPNFTLRTKTPLVATVLPAGKAAAYEAPAPLVSPPAKCPFHAALGLQQKSGNQENQVAEGAR